MEILAPAGGEEQLLAAVRSGADAVYLGTRGFNARRRAENFGEDALKNAVRYCHGRGVRVHVTVNTLVTDGELPALFDTVREVAESGADAVILQDLAAAALFRDHVPDLPRHASTQMSIHSVEGALLAKELGFRRVILARELTLEEIRRIHEAVDIELEAFVHGALCMSVSGQCLLSAMLGDRSGNRGLCAQPCRLDFRAGERDYALSLKDNCLIPWCRDLAAAGVSSLKIEGRLRRPEYVAAAVDACRTALRGEPPDLGRLERVFSRSGFTDGYLTGRRTLGMFGRRREEERADAAVLGELSALYRRERSAVAVDMELTVKPEAPVRITVTDGANTVTAEGAPPEPVRTSPPDFRQALGRTGGTPFFLRELREETVPGWTAKLNPLRREALEKLLALRETAAPWPVTGEPSFEQPENKNPQPKLRRYNEESLAEFASADAKEFEMVFRTDMCRAKNTSHGADCASEGSAGSGVQSPPHEAQRSGFGRKNPQPKLRLRFESIEQFFDFPEAELLILPVEAIDEALQEQYGARLAAELPRLVFPGEEEALRRKLRALREKGLQRVLAGNPGTLRLGRELGFRVFGDVGLNILNRRALAEWAALGAEEALLSPEIRMQAARSLGEGIPRGVVVYGRLPLMLFRCCPMQGEKGCGDCTGRRSLRDRRGVDFPVLCRGKRYSALLNSVPLYVGDRELWGLDFLLAYFTTEDPEECRGIAELLRDGAPFPDRRTLGPYYRGVK